ncbi:ABC transporter substrate-binding protein [Pseudochrobactrum sp. HB0163]|uniref:ABC transporter substrate-binding protein n=1 Tax=Pseudochrobactrum sp. HB0163 TaxID=3450708 RepID=UPI003F6E2683
MARYHDLTGFLKRQAAVAACLLCFLNLQARAENAPQRVVSLNLCTDILALSLADPAQILSVSHIAADPVSSPVAQQAKKYNLNHSGLEEILALKPDLVLASVYTAPDKLAALEQAGIPVERFGYAQNFADIVQQIAHMGNVLGRKPQADAQIAALDQALAALPEAEPVTALVYEPNGYISGAGTLADETMRQLGITNLAATDNKTGAGRISLEDLVRLKPDLVIEPEFYAKPALAYQNYHHPVMEALTSREGKGQAGHRVSKVSVPGRYWSCGSVYILEAVKILRNAQYNLTAQGRKITGRKQ